MTLTVRLDPTLEVALERYCTRTGTSKSLVVQESLAVYLLEKKVPAGAVKTGFQAGGRREPSPLFKAFQEAGLVGTGSLGGGSADKAGVRARAVQRIRRSEA